MMRPDLWDNDGGDDGEQEEEDILELPETPPLLTDDDDDGDNEDMDRPPRRLPVAERPPRPPVQAAPEAPPPPQMLLLPERVPIPIPELNILPPEARSVVANWTQIDRVCIVCGAQYREANNLGRWLCSQGVEAICLTENNCTSRRGAVVRQIVRADHRTDFQPLIWSVYDDVPLSGALKQYMLPYVGAHSITTPHHLPDARRRTDVIGVRRFDWRAARSFEHSNQWGAGDPGDYVMRCAGDSVRSGFGGPPIRTICSSGEFCSETWRARKRSGYMAPERRRLPVALR